MRDNEQKMWDNIKQKGHTSDLVNRPHQAKRDNKKNIRYSKKNI